MTAPIQIVTDDELKTAIIERQLAQAGQIDELLAKEAEKTAKIEEKFHGKLFLVDPETHQLSIKDSNSLNILAEISLGEATPDQELDPWGNHLALIEQSDHSYQGPLAKNSIEPYGLVQTPTMSYAYLSELSKSNFLGLVNSYCFGNSFKSESPNGPYDLFLSSKQSYLAVTDRSAGTINLIDTENNQLVTKVKVRDAGSKKAINVVFDEVNHRIISTDNQSSSLKIIDLQSFELSEHNPGLGILGNIVKVKGQPTGFVLSLKPKPALHQIDLDQLKLIKSISIKGQFFSVFRNDPCDLFVMSPDNQHLIFMTYLNAPKPLTPVLSVVNTEQFRTVRRYSIKGGKKPSWLTFSIENPLKDMDSKTLSDLLVEARLVDRNTLQNLKYELTKEAQESQESEPDPMESASPEHLALLNKIAKQAGFNLDDPLEGKTIVGGQGIEDLMGVEELGILLKRDSFELPMALTPILIGRDSKCTLQIESMMVSRFHAVIYKFGKNYFIHDLHSTNGVILNGTRVFHSELRPGDEIEISDNLIQILDGPPIVSNYSNKCVVVFLDIANYTSMCETHGDKFVQHVRKFMERLQDRTLLSMGCPIKSLGDGYMCAFGLWNVPDKKYSASDSALTFSLYALQSLNSNKNKDNLPPMNLRVGMAYGDVTVLQENDLDLLGDTVNLASRLEYANKVYGSRIMMDEEFYNHLKNKAAMRELDTVRVQGKAEPTTIYSFDERLVSVETEEDMAKIETCHKSYSEGLTLYRQGKFDAALNAFDQAAVLKDSAAICMQQRIRTQLVAGGFKADDSWDGVWNIEKE